MKNLMDLFDGLVYNKFVFNFLGFSGGSKQYPPYDYIPDRIVFLHRINLN